MLNSNSTNLVIDSPELTKSYKALKLKPLISIYIPTYNGARFLGECLKSAFNQDFWNYEIVIADDISTDKTLELALDLRFQFERQLKAQSRLPIDVRIYKHSNKLGLAANSNAALRLCKGEWIKFLYQDDYLETNCLTDMYLIAMKDLEQNLIVCDRKLDFNGDYSDQTKTRWNEFIEKHSLRKFGSQIGATEFSELVAANPSTNAIGEPSAVMINKATMQWVGGFNEHLVQLLDWELFARIGASCGLTYIEKQLSTFRIHEDSASHKNLNDGSGFKAKILDNIIILHELLYSPYYWRVRLVPNAIKSLNHKFKIVLRNAANLIRSDSDGEAWNKMIGSHWRMARCLVSN